MLKQAIHYLARLREELDSRTLQLFIAGVILILLSSLAILFIEDTDHFAAFSDALWWAIVTATTVGYGDIYPRTLAGRMIAILLMTLGISTFGGLTAKLADVLIVTKRKKERGEVVADYEDHLVVCGWNQKAKEIIKQILNENLDYKQIALVADLERDPFPDTGLVHFVAGKMESKEVIEQAGIRQARAAIVLNQQGNDAQTVLTVLNIENLNSAIYTIAEISDRKHEVHLKNANIDEILVDQDLNSQLLVRSALYEGTSKVVKDLLSNQQGNEIYMLEVGEAEIGRHFFQLLVDYKEEKNIILIGVKRQERVITNPDSGLEIESGDCLIYIAPENISD